MASREELPGLPRARLPSEAARTEQSRRFTVMLVGAAVFGVGLLTLGIFASIKASLGQEGAGVLTVCVPLLAALSGVLVLVLSSVVHRTRMVAQSARRDLRAQAAELERLALVVRATRNLVVITDADRLIVWANRAFEEQTGYTLTESIGRSPGSLLQCEGTDPETKAVLHRYLSAGQECRVEILNRSRSGHEYWLDMEIQPLPVDPATGRPSGFIAVESDVTEQVLLRQRMKAATERFDRAVRGSSDALWEYTPATGHVWYSDRYFEMLGEELGGFPPAMSSWTDRLHPDDSARAIDAMKRHLTDLAPYDQEFRLRCASGRYRWFRARGDSVRDPGGLATIMAGTLSDTTERKELEARLVETARALEEAQAIARSGNWSFDIQSGVVTWSKEVYHLFGRSERDGPPDFAGVLSDYAPESAKTLEAAVNAAATEGKPYSLILETACGDPAVRFVRGEGRARRNEDGQVVELYGTATDVTAEIEREAALRAARAAAESASRAKSEFLANMSHEIRTPMTAILGFADLLSEEAEHTPAQRRDAVATIRRNGEHLLELINDILDVSKIEAGKMAVESIATDPAQVVSDVQTLMEVRAKAKGISLVSEYPTTIPRAFRSDPLRLKQILVNLVGNAIKFTEVGSVVVKASFSPGESGPGELRIEVADSGVGMTPAQIAKLFQPFTQADETTARRFGGSGLGLTIVKRLSEMLGGALSVRSELGRGSVFVASFRVDAESSRTDNLWMPSDQRLGATPAPRSEQADAAAKPLAGARVLLTEDGADNQRLITFHLRRAGATVTIAENGLVALNALTEGEAPARRLRSPLPFDMVLMDMQMPVMDGYTAAGQMRSMACTLPIVALTANAMSEDSERCLAAGCDDYASKPINVAKLIALCARWMNQPRGAARPSGVGSAAA